MTGTAERPSARWLRIFRYGRKLHVPTLLAFAVINGLVLVNCFLHDPQTGYDGGEHMRYVQTLADARLPGRTDTYEFFSPPLPYALPALAYRLTGSIHLAGKVGQCGNALLSIGLVFLLLKTCRLLSRRPSPGLGTLVFLGTLTVYYKTFAFVRGEPYGAFFAVLAVYGATLVFIRMRHAAPNVILLGLALGLGALSRQWGVLIFPAVALFAGGQWLRHRPWRRAIATSLGLAFLLGAVTGGWFYAVLKLRHGSAAAFNQKRETGFTLRNHPADFYLGVRADALFHNPVRPALGDHLLPLFYSELWGDYWCYFVVYGRDTRRQAFLSGRDLAWRFKHGRRRPAWLQTNYKTVGPYLGRVNLVALYPSALALLALAWAAVRSFRSRARAPIELRRREAAALLVLATAATLAGYLWFILMHSGGGNGLKIRATHVLNVFPFLAIMVGNLLEQAERKSRLLYGLLLGGLLLTFAHNVGAMITRY